MAQPNHPNPIDRLFADQCANENAVTRLSRHVIEHCLVEASTSDSTPPPNIDVAHLTQLLNTAHHPPNLTQSDDTSATQTLTQWLSTFIDDSDDTPLPPDPTDDSIPDDPPSRLSLRLRSHLQQRRIDVDGSTTTTQNLSLDVIEKCLSGVGGESIASESARLVDANLDDANPSTLIRLCLLHALADDDRAVLQVAIRHLLDKPMTLRQRQQLLPTLAASLWNEGESDAAQLCVAEFFQLAFGDEEDASSSLERFAERVRLADEALVSSFEMLAMGYLMADRRQEALVCIAEELALRQGAASNIGAGEQALLWSRIGHILTEASEEKSSGAADVEKQSCADSALSDSGSAMASDSDTMTARSSAAECHRRAVVLAPTSIRCWRNAAMAAWRRGGGADRPEALASMQRAIDLATTDRRRQMLESERDVMRTLAALDTAATNEQVIDVLLKACDYSVQSRFDDTELVVYDDDVF